MAAADSQVTGSTGVAYTIYAHFPSVARPPETHVAADERADLDRAASPTPGTSDTDLRFPSTPADQLTSHFRQSAQANQHGEGDGQASEKEATEVCLRQERDSETWRRISSLAQTLARLYCPCAGFMFNSMGGSRNVLVGTLQYLQRASDIRSGRGDVERTSGIERVVADRAV